LSRHEQVYVLSQMLLMHYTTSTTVEKDEIMLSMTSISNSTSIQKYSTCMIILKTIKKSITHYMYSHCCVFVSQVQSRHT